ISGHFAVAVSFGTDRARLLLRGELDMASVALLDERFQEACAAGRSLIVIDLTDVTFCDSSGIRALLRAAEHCRSDGTTLRIVGAQRPVRRVFELTATANLLHLGDDA